MFYLLRRKRNDDVADESRGREYGWDKCEERELSGLSSRLDFPTPPSGTATLKICSVPDGPSRPSSNSFCGDGEVGGAAAEVQRN